MPPPSHILTHSLRESPRTTITLANRQNSKPIPNQSTSTYALRRAKHRRKTTGKTEEGSSEASTLASAQAKLFADDSTVRPVATVVHSGLSVPKKLESRSLGVPRLFACVLYVCMCVCWADSQKSVLTSPLLIINRLR